MTGRTSITSSPEPLAYLNGRWLPLSQAAVGVFDVGFLQGVAIPEQLRTFGGRLFRLEQHLDRLERSLEIVGVDPQVSRAELTEIANTLVEQNRKLLDPADDVGLTIFVTPGISTAFAGRSSHSGPTVCIHTQPLPFHTWVDKYETGDALVVTDVQQVPAACWPPELKCRSRMHYYLADRQANQMERGARALLLDGRGMVTEASTANVLIHTRGEGLVSPPQEHILPGVTVSVVEELAAQLGIGFARRDLTVDDVSQADEVLLCSTSPCVWSAVRLNGRPIGDGSPGPVAARLRAAWSQMVGVDLDEQARRFAAR
jgi:branched-subunit amino acid aminotransferase/4-amino-4-deoxychorismate lyase